MGTAQQQDRHVGKKRLLSLISAAAVTFAASVAFVTGTGPAAADPVDRCTSTRGAIVAVDFGPFGGGVVRGCDTTPTTGYDLLHEGGFTTEGTQHDGDGFICRIGTSAFNSGKRYPTPATEDCVLTPQASSYWSYWIASPDEETWSYSPLGAMSRKPKAGDVDAWVFGATDIGGSTGRPSFTPDEVRASGGATPTPTDGSTGPGVPAGKIDVPAAGRWVSAQLRDGTAVVDEGSESPNDLLTTEALYALAAANGKGAALDKVAAHLTTRVVPYAYPNGTDVAPDATAAARLALAAVITGRDPHDVGGRDLLGDLVKHVCPAGPDAGSPTPGCTGKGDFHGATNTDGQALSVLALLRGAVEPPAATVTRLAQQACPNGSVSSTFIRPGENCTGDPMSTALVAPVLKAVGGHDAAVTKARTYLRKAQSETGAFLAYEGAPAASVTTTAYAAQALRALGETKAADAAVAWLSREQLDGGGFGFDAGDTEPALYATVPAVLAGAGVDLVTLVAKDPEPSRPPTTPAPPATGSATPRPTPRPPGAGPDLKKGVAFLTRPSNLLQGRYYDDGTRKGRAEFGMTIDGAYALAATGHDDNALRTIVDFLADGGKDGTGRTVHDWSGIGTKYAQGGRIGKAALLAQAVERDPRDFGGRDLIAAVTDAVCEKPSTAPDKSCPAEGAYTYSPSVFAQSLGILAQVRAGEEKAAEAPIAYLAGLQHDSGAWPSLIPSTGDSDVDSTAMAAMTLDLVPGDAHAPAVDKALAWIAGRQLADGGFPGASGNSVNSAGLAVQGLSLDAEKYDAQITKALKFLTSQQNKDGGFNVAKNGQRGSDIRASAQAVGGATGISFGVLSRSLEGTTPNPVPSSSAPVIVTPGENGGSGIVNADGPGGGGGDGGSLASTGVQALALAAAAAVLVLAGRLAVVAARDRRTAAGGQR
ncbi:prenyltransferase/squalene oxidase repeat-containing protein [Streptomyces californicus]|uniref:prenyltransferase/squalene oxidase repeat-containing protein n=1 Tax=Streptomyces californicus TaxID=67351 RepID=UPI0037D050A2